VRRPRPDRCRRSAGARGSGRRRAVTLRVSSPVGAEYCVIFRSVQDRPHPLPPPGRLLVAAITSQEDQLMTADFSLTGGVALVTGAGSGSAGR
jgi:hypothetical protein